MSLGYADRLSHREDLGGQLGAPELQTSPRGVVAGVEQLAELVQKAERVMAFTGAGISTACGIPDFRGPNGIWTLQRAGKPPPQLQTSFVYALPSLTHMALVGLMQSGKLTYVCSQNVDGLHLRSGVPRDKLAELHGNCFAERCELCGCEYVRDFEMESVGFKHTGRMCTQPGCGGHLKDHILDWEDGLPEDELEASEEHASEADLSLCLGTSLQIYPAANLPLRTLKSGGSMAIINLQATPKDRRATLVLHTKVDPAMALLMQKLQLPIPPFSRTDSVRVSHTLTNLCSANGSQQQPDAGNGAQHVISAGSSWGFTFEVCSPHGKRCPMPMVDAVDVTFPGTTLPEGAHRREGRPFTLRRDVEEDVEEVTAHVVVQLGPSADADKRSVIFEYVVSRSAQQGSSEVSFLTQQHDYTHQQQRQAAELLDAAAQQPPGVDEPGQAPKRKVGRPQGKTATSAAKYAETELDANLLGAETSRSGSGRPQKRSRRLDL